MRPDRKDIPYTDLKLIKEGEPDRLAEWGNRILWFGVSCLVAGLCFASSLLSSPDSLSSSRNLQLLDNTVYFWKKIVQPKGPEQALVNATPRAPSPAAKPGVFATPDKIKGGP